MNSCLKCGYVFVLPDEDCPRCALRNPEQGTDRPAPPPADVTNPKWPSRRFLRRMTAMLAVVLVVVVIVGLRRRHAAERQAPAAQGKGATVGTSLWSYQYLARGSRLEPGTTYRISVAEKKEGSSSFVLQFSTAAGESPQPFRLTVLLGGSGAPTAIQDVLDPGALSMQSSGRFVCALEVPKGSKLCLAKPVPGNSHAGPIVCLSNILEL